MMKNETPEQRLWPSTIYDIAHTAVSRFKAIQKVDELAQLLDYYVKGYNIEEQYSAIMEIGTHYGGTYWAWNEVSEYVLGIDKIDRPEHKGLNILHRDSHDPETIDTVRGNGIKFDMIFIDGEHSMNSVLLDWANYKEFLKPDGFMAFHDICPTFFYDMDTNKPCTVDKAWEKIKTLGSQTLEFIEPPTHWGGIGVWHP